MKDKTLWIANIVLGIVGLIGLLIMFTPMTNAGEDGFDTEHARNYLMGNKLTTAQVDYIISQTHRVDDKDHFISWFGAIFRHENGATPFVDGEKNYLAGRLKKGMGYKPFTVQMDGRITAYNRYWKNHDTTYGRVDVSRYCRTDTHGGQPGCPNWKASVPKLRSKYFGGSYVPETATVITQQVDYYKQAKATQNKLDKIYVDLANTETEARKLWRECKTIGQCTQ